MITRTLAELAAELGGALVGDGSTVIRGVAGIREAQPGEITFLANARYEPHLAETRAAAVICSREPRRCGIPLIQVDNPYLAFQRAVRVFRPDLHRPEPGIHASAVLSPTAHIGSRRAGNLRQNGASLCCLTGSTGDPTVGRRSPRSASPRRPGGSRVWTC